MLTQTDARLQARALSTDTGQIYVAVTLPLGCWGGTETGWGVLGPNGHLTDTLTEYNRLKDAHTAAQEAGRPIHGQTDREIQAEQDAYDALIDYVDANGLTYTTYDPRGTR